MQEITSAARLKDAILLLEVKQAEKRQLLKEQLFITYDSLKPINLIKGALNDVSTSPYLINNIVGTILGLGTGYLSKKLVVGGSANLFRKLMGSILQFGVTNIVAQHPDAIKSIGQFIIQHFLRKKKMNSENP
jgi:hypothetical protein